MKQYRIGEFARELGVTPDFLKYCEKQGYLTPHVEPNGYRYYDFVQSAQIIEYMKFRNQGFTAKEISEALHESSFAGSVERMEERREAIERQIAFHQALLQYTDYLKAIQPYFCSEPVWHIRQIEGFYFLPHSVDMEFIQDNDVRRCVQAWNPYMPIVTSAKKLPLCKDGTLRAEGEGLTWGYAVDASFARQLKLPVCQPVEYVAPGRYLEVFQHRDLGKRTNQYVRDVEAIANRCGLRPAGDAYCRVIAKIMEDGVRREYSVLYLPVEG